MKRSYDFHRVRSHRPYTIATLAALLGVDKRTVRRWIESDRLDVAIVEHSRPVILLGSKVKAWGTARQRAKKQPCAYGEIYCVRCKTPRRIKPDSFLIVQPNQSKLTVKGECCRCDLTLNRFGSPANRAALEAEFGPKRPDNPAA
ncbi:hypothetical protein GCM10011309_23980 [Litorimonas cladophorae]|uniref:Helix-turn-helix domain-containing protein n=1 Tax=Litorimonas cladophorae TaxID=1220491 RepID=A0A918KRG4_9PROT|nr:helix-turn-helix domain-containing protein [Litorimonas cladophorae]GGX73184.1 hypothetical protein GCM10011309_23980 [Litorimonas cladophorae]